MKQRAVRRPGEMWVGAFLVTFGAIAFAADWTPVGTDADGNSYAVDLSRLSREGAVVRVEVRTEYAKPRKDDSTGKDVFVAVDRMAVDCGSSRFAVESRTYVAADGTEIPRGARPRDKLRFRPAAAGSMSEAIVRVACKPRG